MSTTTEALQRLKRDISSEDDLQQYLERGMESNGWTVLREVQPRNSDYRADIVAGRDDIGWFGIECKYVTGGPVVAAKAARQVLNKYAGEKFLNRKVVAWGVCLYGHRFTENTADRDDFEDVADYRYHCAALRTQKSVTQRIMNGLGIGWTTVSSGRVMLEFLPSHAGTRVPLFQVDGNMPSRYAEKVDMERIEQLVTERRLD